MNPGSSIHLVPFLFVPLFISCSHVKTDLYPNGNIRSEITMRGEHYHGPAVFYYDDGTILMECTYSNDSLDGLVTRYFQNGTKKERMFYTNNKADSTYRLWNPQGQLLVECSYHDNLLNGNYRDYYDNGTLKSSGQYRCGHQVGQWLFYDQNGYLVRKEN